MKSRTDIIIDNFLGGIAWGLGATIGLAVVLAIIGFILSKIGVVPIIGNFALQINEFITNRRK